MKKLVWLYLTAALGTANATDHWWEIRIAGEPAGYEHISTETLEGGAVRTTDEQVIVINRLGNRVEVKVKAVSVENAAGNLLTVREETSSSQQTLVTEAEVQETEFVLHSKSGSNVYTRSIPRRGPVCGPEAFTRMTREMLRKSGDSVTCRLFQPSTGPSRFTYKLLGEEVVDGRTLLRVMVTIGDAQQGKFWLFERDGNPFQAEQDMPFGKMVVRAVDREQALQAAAGGNLPSESYDRTMARSNVRFADARAIDRIIIKITQKRPDLGWPALRGPGQRILEQSPSTVILEVVSPQRKAAPSDNPETRYLTPNQVLQSDDPEVARLARELAGDEPDKFKAMRKLQDWVANNLNFDLGIALAPASEVVRNRRGTCVAYAVLLASMARAVGIPSRVAMGYIYLSGIWGGHAWAEVLIDGQWLPFDSAAYRPGVADAARFQFDSYTLEDNLVAGSLAGLKLYGNVDIAVLEYTIAGKTVHVSEPSSPYSIAGDEYRNPWLGFSLRKPDGSAFAKLDAVYPDPTLLEIKSETAHATVGLLEVVASENLKSRLPALPPDMQTSPAKLGGRDAVVVSTADIVQLLSREGESVWVITAQGQDARVLLDQIAGAWTWISPE